MQLQQKLERNKIKIGIFTAIFLIQYFYLHDILPFSKSHSEIASTWTTARCKRGKSSDVIVIVICATLCVGFSSKSKATSVIPKRILKSKARDQSIQARKELLCQVEVKNYLHNVLRRFLIKTESTWRREIKEQTP